MAPSLPQLRTIAIVLAGGTGTRIGLDIPKQLLKIAGKTILEHTLDAFESHAEIDEILIVMATGFAPAARRIVALGGYRKVSGVLDGGAERVASTANAIAALTDRHQSGGAPDCPGSDCNVLFHDAVRPLLEPRIISDCVAALRTHAAVDVAIPSADTVITVDEDEIITGIPPRARLRRGQTPQAFRLSVIRRAYELARADPDFARSPATDDCGVVLRYLPGTPIAVVRGSEFNMKVTHPVDVYVADKLFQLARHDGPPPVPAAERRARLAGKTMVVFGGSYGIGADVCAVARQHGARVFSFSRTQTGTHVENSADVEAALQEACQATGQIDFVVNTAALLSTGKLADTDPAAIEEIIKVNYLAPVTIARAAVGYLAQTRGHLLLYTSSSYTRGRAGYSLYSSAKAAVVNLTQALADEWSELSVKVNCINPERTQTPMRLRAFGVEPADSLLAPMAVALTSVDVLLSELTGHVVDVRRLDPLGAASGFGPRTGPAGAVPASTGPAGTVPTSTGPAGLADPGAEIQGAPRAASR